MSTRDPRNLSLVTSNAGIPSSFSNTEKAPSLPPQSQPASPMRPPVSPITPIMEPARLATGMPPPPSPAPPASSQGRPTFTHSQPDQIGIPPPIARPIAFDDNPDVLALKSAISILQMQRARAVADMHALRRAKEAAMSEPCAFIADLAAGRVRAAGDPLLNPQMHTVGRGTDSDPDSDSGSDSDFNSGSDVDGDASMVDAPHATAEGPSRTREAERSCSRKSSANREDNPKPSKDVRKAWCTLPKPQSVVRCPPVNWTQYGVVGESLDKLHAEQLAAPTPGAPISLKADETYDFKAGGESVEPGRRLMGVAVPYTPGKDVLEKRKACRR